MEQLDKFDMLDLMVSPVFCVKDGHIVKLNEAATHLFLQEGTELSQLLQAGREEYAAYTGGLLWVTLNLNGQNWGAAVTRMGGYDVFTLDQQFDSSELRALALAARDLRLPLANAMLAAQQLPESDHRSLGQLNRGLQQLLRIIGNMSDASGSGPSHCLEALDADSFFREILKKAEHLTENSGKTLQYSGLEETVYLPADRQKLERAVLNMLSNALKFSPAEGCITAELARSGKQLRFSVTDQGCGIQEQILPTLFRRYLREPAIEDTRHGIGLGMLMIRNAAAAHGGAVLADKTPDGGTRITMTLSLEAPPVKTLRCHSLCADYAGELDHALLELSELLPSELYNKN